MWRIYIDTAFTLTLGGNELPSSKSFHTLGRTMTYWISNSVFVVNWLVHSCRTVCSVSRTCERATKRSTNAEPPTARAAPKYRPSSTCPAVSTNHHLHHLFVQTTIYIIYLSKPSSTSSICPNHHLHHLFVQTIIYIIYLSKPPNMSSGNCRHNTVG